MLINGHDSGLT